MPCGCDDSRMNGASDAYNKRAAHPARRFGSPNECSVTVGASVNGSTISSSPEQKPACSILFVTPDLTFKQGEPHGTSYRVRRARRHRLV